MDAWQRTSVLCKKGNSFSICGVKDWKARASWMLGIYCQLSCILLVSRKSYLCFHSTVGNLGVVSVCKVHQLNGSWKQTRLSTFIRKSWLMSSYVLSSVSWFLGFPNDSYIFLKPRAWGNNYIPTWWVLIYCQVITSCLECCGLLLEDTCSGAGDIARLVECLPSVYRALSMILAPQR